MVNKKEDTALFAIRLFLREIKIKKQHKYSFPQAKPQSIFNIMYVLETSKKGLILFYIKNSLTLSPVSI